MPKIQKLTIANRIIAIITWILCLSVLTLNLLGQWDLWQFVGLLSCPCVLLSVAFSLAVLQESRALGDDTDRKKYVRKSVTMLIICTVVALLDLFVFCTWFGL